MSYASNDLVSISRGEGRYRKSLLFNFEEACNLLETELPSLIRESLDAQAAELETYNKNLARAKALGLL
jgi:hypothetical protein